MKINKKFHKRFTCFFISLTLVAIGLVNINLISHAGEGNTTVNSDRNTVSIRKNNSTKYDEGSSFVIDANGTSFEAICIGYTQHAPEKGTIIDNVYASNDVNLRKALYYGYGGPENARWSGFATNSAALEGTVEVTPSNISLYEAYSRIVTGIAASAIYQGYETHNWMAIPFYNYIMDSDTPDPNVATSYTTFFSNKYDERPTGNLNIKSYSDGDIQRTDDIYFCGESSLSISIKLYSPYSLVVADKKYDGTENGTAITIRGGDCFYAIAPITHTGSLNIEAVSLNEPEYKAMVLVTASDEIQDLGAIKTVYNTVTNGVNMTFEAPKGRIRLQKEAINQGVIVDNPMYSLEGAEYGIYLSEEDAKKNNNLIDTIVTDATGYGESRDMLYGNYYIREIKPSMGFVVDEKVYTVVINSILHQNIIESYEKEKSTDDLLLLLKKDDFGDPVEGAKYKINFYPGLSINENVNEADDLTPSRSWVFITDDEGRILFDKAHLVEGDELFLDSEGLCRLPYGAVVIEEVQAPEGYLIDSNKYYINIGEDDNGLIFHNLVNSVDRRLIPKLTTYAVDKNTQTHMALIAEHTIIVDSCSYSDLISGAEYELVGTMVDALTGELVTDSQGNAIRMKKSFIASELGTEEIEFDVSGYELSGKKVVIFEELYRNGELIACHKELSDYGQTIYFPSIHTELLDVESNSHTVMLKKDIAICDKVYYEQLDTRKTYILRGVLYRKSTGKILTDRYGKEIIQDIAFTPSEENGIIDMNFMFDCTGIDLYKDEIVCYEYLYLDDKLIAVHEDNSGLQSVNCDMPNKPVVIPFHHIPEMPDIPEEPDTPNTGDNIDIFGLMLGMLYSILGLVIIKCVKNKYKNYEK